MKSWIVFLQLWALREITGCRTMLNASFDSTIEDGDRNKYLMDVEGNVQVENVTGAVGGGAAHFKNGGQLSFFRPIVWNKVQVMFRFKVDENLTAETQYIAHVSFHDDCEDQVSVLFYRPSTTFCLMVGLQLVSCSPSKTTATSEFRDLSLELSQDVILLKDDGYEICKLAKTGIVGYWHYTLEIGKYEDFSGYIDEEPIIKIY